MVEKFRSNTTIGMDKPSPEYFFLINLFNLLNQAEIRYAVLRNYKTLPFSSGGSDLDILVHPDDTKRAKAILFASVKQAGGVLLGCIESVDWSSFFAMGFTIDDNGQRLWWGAVLDLFIDKVFFRGASPILEFDWDSREIHNGVFAVQEEIGAVLGVLKEVLHDRFPERYLKLSRRVAHSKWDILADPLHPLGDVALQMFRQLLIESSTSTKSVKSCATLRREVCYHAFKRTPGTYLIRRFRFEWSKVRRYLKPTGIVVVILGVDGAGKSTVINTIKPVLDAATHNATFVQHLRPSLLPPLARLKGQTEVPSGPVLDPHGSTPSGTLGSLLRLTWLTLDYIFGYWLRTRLIIAKQPAIVIFDRYAYDMALDPRRFRIGLPGWVAGLFARLAPRPDLILCLHADPEVIAVRKQELPLEETRRQVEALRAFAKTQPNAVLISTEGTIEQVRERALSTLFDFFAKRATHGCNPN